MRQDASEVVETKAQRLQRELQEAEESFNKKKAEFALTSLIEQLEKNHPLSTINDFLDVLDGKKIVVDVEMKTPEAKIEKKKPDSDSSTKRKNEKVDHIPVETILEVIGDKKTGISKKEISDSLGLVLVTKRIDGKTVIVENTVKRMENAWKILTGVATDKDGNKIPAKLVRENPEETFPANFKFKIV